MSLKNQPVAFAVRNGRGIAASAVCFTERILLL